MHTALTIATLWLSTNALAATSWILGCEIARRTAHPMSPAAPVSPR